MNDYIDQINAVLGAIAVVATTGIGIYWKLRKEWATQEQAARQTLLDSTSEKVKEAIKPVADTTAPHLLEVIITFATRLGALEEKIHELEEVTVAQRKEIERLQSELEHKVAELDRLQQQYEAALADKAALLREIEALRGEIAILRAEIAKLRG